jgi:hypothetical protein
MASMSLDGFLSRNFRDGNSVTEIPRCKDGKNHGNRLIILSFFYKETKGGTPE